MLDAGEGSWSQMLAMGVDIASIRGAWISHPHADHHLGLLRIIIERYKRNSHEKKSPFLVVAPPSVVSLLEELVAFESSLGGMFVALSCCQFDVDSAPSNTSSGDYNSVNSILLTLGIQSLNCCKVDHCLEAFAVRLNLASGLSVVYSGDTRPCERLVKLGTAATILLHEATFGDEKKVEAIEKRHSTVGEAIDISRRCGAHRTILTHYSQRYPSFPPLTEVQLRSVTLSFDFMRVSFKDLVWSHHLTPVLVAAFPPEEESDEVSGALDEIADSARKKVGAFVNSRRCIKETEGILSKRKKSDSMM